MAIERRTLTRAVRLALLGAGSGAGAQNIDLGILGNVAVSGLGYGYDNYAGRVFVVFGQAGSAMNDAAIASAQC